MNIAKEIAQQLDDDMVDNYKAYGDSHVDQDYVELMISKKLEPVRDVISLVLNCGGWYYSALEIDVYDGYNGENIEKELKSVLVMLSEEE